MMFLQAAAAANRPNELPITRHAAERAVANYANSLFLEIPTDFWEELRRFDEPRQEIARDDMHMKMLFNLHVFEYMNGAYWYEVNPVLRTLKQFKS